MNSADSDKLSIEVSGEIDSLPDSNSEGNVKLFHRILMQLPEGVQASAPIAWEWLQHRRSNVRPWTTFLSTSKFKTPVSVPRLTTRVSKNVEYFQSNYMFVFVGLIIFCLLTSPLLLLAVGASLGACYILSLKNVDRKIVIAGHEVQLAHQYAAVALFSLPIFYMAGAGAAIFWVLGASFFVIMVHASFYNIDTILGSEDEPFDLQMEQV